ETLAGLCHRSTEPPDRRDRQVDRPSLQFAQPAVYRHRQAQMDGRVRNCQTYLNVTTTPSHSTYPGLRSSAARRISIETVSIGKRTSIHPGSATISPRRP